MASVVNAVNELRASGLNVRAACSKAGASHATYYRFKDALVSDERPAIMRDWSSLAEGWQPRSLKGLTKQQRILLRRDVAQALRQIFSRSATPVTDSSNTAFVHFARTFEDACDAYDALDDHSRDLLEAIAETDGQQRRFVDLFGAIQALSASVADLSSVYGSHLREAGYIRQGPKHDPRVDKLIAALARIWECHTGEAPTHWVDQVTDQAGSKFNRFVLSVQRRFLRGLKIRKYSLIWAMERTCVLEYDDGAVSGPNMNGDYSH